MTTCTPLKAFRCWQYRKDSTGHFLPRGDPVPDWAKETLAFWNDPTMEGWWCVEVALGRRRVQTLWFTPAEFAERFEIEAEPQGTFTCDVCGRDTPHGHGEFDVLQERFVRPAFEKRYTELITSSWDGDTSIHVPQRTSRDLAAGYHGETNNRRWYTYVNAWWDAWEYFKERFRVTP
jgi:hypothetical protein